MLRGGDPDLRNAGAVVGGIVVLVVVALAVILFGGVVDAQENPDQPLDETLPDTDIADTDIAVTPLTVRLEDHDDNITRQLIDELAPTSVLQITTTGFPGNTTGAVMQCATDVTRSCSNRLRVNFDDDGHATFQYLVTDTVGESGGCRLAASIRCTLEIQSEERTVVVDTVFVDRAPTPGRLTLSSSDPLALGSSVAVIVSEFPPNVDLTVAVCAVPATRGSRCGAPAPTLRLITDQDGRAKADLTLDLGEVGSDGISCGRRTRCQLVVSGETIGVRAAPLRLNIVETAGATYDGTRLLAGLALAAVFGVVMVWLSRSIDWQPPDEADASAIDDAEYADLDAEADLFVDILAER